MNKNSILPRSGLCLLSLIAFLGATHAAEYFVSPEGADGNNGLSRETAFATIQHGVDALEPGDILTIAPGEYHEAVKRADLGSMEAETIIRAEIPGTAILRGDRPTPEFHKLEGSDFVYTADFDHDGEIYVVNELDTLSIFQSRPNVSEVEFTPGTFHYDREGGKLYVSPSDGQPASAHLYSVSVIGKSGISLTSPKRVVLDGLALTGFNTSGFDSAGRGIAMSDARECIIRNCYVWMNGWGVEVSSSDPESGGNLIEKCVAWANDSPFANFRRGGLNFVRHRGDVIRDSTAFLNAFAGVYLRSDSAPEKSSRLVNNLTWGNRWDSLIKGNPGQVNVTEQSVGGKYSVWSESPRRNNPTHSLVVSGELRDPTDLTAYSSLPISPTNIWLDEEEGVDAQSEFADPDNHDYRLQATSRFRGAGPDGVDRGPFPYEENIFFVSPAGDDAADGLSIKNAWSTIQRGLRDLRPGDTLYISPGTYREDIDAHLGEKKGAPISIRGRGIEPVVIQGTTHVSDSANIEFQRLGFDGPLVVDDSADIALEQCTFTGAETSVKAEDVTDLRVTHCAFSEFNQAAISLKNCEGVHLSGNLIDNRDGVAVLADSLGALRYADYNAYRDPNGAWEAGGRKLALTDLASDFESHGRAIPEDFDSDFEVSSLHHRPPFLAAGPMGMPFGLYRGEPRREKLRLTSGPVVQSVSATTANIEWRSILPSRVHLAWGDTPEMENRQVIDAGFLGTTSLMGLKPGRKYYFQIQSLEENPLSIGGHSTSLSVNIQVEPVQIDSNILTFTTLQRDPAPRTLYVAPDGNNANSGLTREEAWRTVQHAANNVNVGDTVMLADGEYREQVRIRSTGAPQAPITFRSIPGDRVVFSGAQLSNAFDVSNKGHLRFDGMYFLSMQFNLYKSRDIQMTRIFSGMYDKGYPPPLLNAFHCEDLLVKNSVVLSAKSGPTLRSCSNVRIENCVFFRNMIAQLSIESLPGQSTLVANSIFTDGISKKVIAPMIHLSRWDSFTERNNCFFPQFDRWEEKFIVWLWSDEAFDRHRISNHMGEVEHPHPQLDEIQRLGLKEMQEYLGETDSILANPEFLGAKNISNDRYPVPAMVRQGVIPMNDFFATNPVLVERGIGLQPQAFEEYHFNQE